MRKRGIINDIERRQQIFDFSYFVNGSKTPSDIDFVWDLRAENLWILGELKTSGVALTKGQRIALTHDLEAHYRSGRSCLGFFAVHDTTPSEVVDVSRCTVQEFWLDPSKGWIKPPDRRYLGEFITSFRRWARSAPRCDRR